MSLYFDRATLLLLFDQAHLRLYHSLVRNNLVVSTDVVEVLAATIGGAGRQELEVRFAGRRFQAAEASEFTPWTGMYNNPDNFIPPERFEALDVTALLTRLERAHVLHQGEPVYEARRTPLDRFRGSIHQQVGTEALRRRVTLEEWWWRQKFDDDGQLRPGPYRDVQGAFLERYFTDRLPGAAVLDVGSGLGYYAYRMSRHAAEVVGIDYNADYVNRATALWCRSGRALVFHRADLLDPTLPAGLQDRRFDFIFLIDIVLYMFAPEFQPQLAARRVEIMGRLAGLLARGGRIVIMDPSPFWLTPRFGTPRYPYGVITEYRHPRHRVTPTLSAMSELLAASSLAITRIFEPGPDPAWLAEGGLDARFVDEFPQWWVFEAVKKEGGGDPVEEYSGPL